MKGRELGFIRVRDASEEVRVWLFFAYLLPEAGRGGNHATNSANGSMHQLPQPVAQATIVDQALLDRQRQRFGFSGTGTAEYSSRSHSSIRTPRPDRVCRGRTRCGSNPTDQPRSTPCS